MVIYFQHLVNNKIMKNTLKIIFCLFLSINSYGQVTVVVPLSPVTNQNGAYFKDLNNELFPYVGTWEGVLNNKKYTFVFQKFTQHLTTYYPYSESYYYRDELMGKFQVTNNTTGEVIYSSLNASSYDEYPIRGIVKPYHGRFSFVFIDTEANCENGLKFMLKNIPNQTNQLKYFRFEYKDSWNIDCTTYSSRMDIPVNLPMQDLILTKL